MRKSFATVVAFIAVYTLSAQPPAPTNLQVLPKDMPRADLIQTMRLFNQALGVQCDHCHVEREFAKDDKPAKLVARKMIHMVHDIQTNAEKYVPDGTATKVACWSCHRGSTMIELPKPPEAPAGKKGGAPKA